MENISYIKNNYMQFSSLKRIYQNSLRIKKVKIIILHWEFTATQYN